MRISIAIVTISLFIPTHGWTCDKSTGKSPKDKQVAEKICAVFKGDPNILHVAVMESILDIDITEALYREMRNDRVRGPELVRGWINGMQIESGFKAVSVRVYYKSTKVIEGDVTMLGERRVKYLDQ